MVSRDFSGEDIVSVLTSFDYWRDRQRSSHTILEYTPRNGRIRIVSVPIHDRIKIGTLQNIAGQCGANEFTEWCRWIDEHR